MKKVSRLSLRQGLYLLIALCWVVPLLAVVVWFGIQQQDESLVRMEESISTSVQHAAEDTARRFSEAMADSRAATTDGILEELHNTYLSNGDAVSHYNGTVTYLQNQYAYNEAFSGAIYLHWGTDTTPMFVPGYGLADANRFQEGFLDRNQTEIMRLAETLDSAIVVVQGEQTVYVVRNLLDKDMMPFATLVLPFADGYLEESGANILWATTVSIALDDVTIPVLGEHVPLEAYDLTYDDMGETFTMGVVVPVDRHQMTLEATVSDAFMLSERTSFVAVVCVMIMVSGVLFFIMVAYFSMNISSPMDNLLHSTEHLEQGDLGYQITTFPRNFEFFQLTVRFNWLSKRLKEQFDRRNLEQEALHDARIKALQSQINPHFLNNTLELINWQARMSGDDKVSEMIEALSVMLNAAMARGGSATVTMKEEFSYIEAYLYIISQRFGSRLTVVKNIEPEVWEAIVPRLILQPIVENAIEHGVARRTNGQIDLHLYTDEGTLILDVLHGGTISDTDRATIDRLLSWDGKENMETGAARIGIRNVHLRLKILCGPDSGLRIWERSPGVVCSRMTMPLVVAPKADNKQSEG